MVDVEVEFDYDAELPDELTIRSGQLITDVKQMDGGWWEGTLKGKRGVFPDNFVKVISKDDMKPQQKPSLSLSSSVDDGLNDDESDDIDSEVKLRPKIQTSSSKSGPIIKRQCRVLFSYAPAHEDELELQMDELIDFLGEVEDGWWRGALNGKTGVFPSNFVEMVNSPGTTEPSLKSPPVGENILESKNKKNDPNIKDNSRVDIVEASRAKISNLIQEAESKAKPGRLPISAFESKPSKNAPKKEPQPRPSFGLGLVASLGSKSHVAPVSAVNTVVIENHNLLKKSNSPTAASNPLAQHPLKGAERRQSPLGRESNPDLKNSASSTSANNVSNISAPRLPPKPVKEQCIVQFPYTALNDDELTLTEGQIVTIITKEVEDKGWWKGEVDGKVGVFPDNFVKLITPSGTNTANGSSEELGGVKAPVAPPATKKPQRPPGSPTLKSNQPKKSGGGSSSSTQTNRQMERKLSSTSSSMDENSRGSREHLDEPDVSLSSPKRVITSSVRERSKKLFNASKDNLSSSSDSSKRNSFGKANPPPRPKPPSASAKPGASTSASNVKPIASTFNKVTAAVTSRFSGSGSKSQNLSMADRHQSLPVTAHETLNLSLDSELDCVERNERLAHPTAGRAKAPKRRPPSSVFVKEAKAIDDVFETMIVPETPDSSLGGDDLSEISSAKDKEALSKSLDSGLSVDCRDPSPTSQLVPPDQSREANKSRLSFKLVRKQVKDVLGGLTNGNHFSTSTDSLQKQKSNEDLTKAASPPKESSVKLASAKKQPPPKPPVVVSTPVIAPVAVLTTANPENNKTERIIPPKVEEPEKPTWLEELSRKQANRKSLLKEHQHNNYHASQQGSNSSGIINSEHASNKSKENEAPTETTTNHGAPVVPENKPVIPIKPSQIKEDVSSRKSMFLSNVKRPSSLGNQPNPDVKPTVITTTGSVDSSVILAHTSSTLSSTSSSTTSGSTTSVTTSCSSTTSSVTSSPEKVPQIRSGSIEKPLVPSLETNPKVVSKETKAVDNSINRSWTKPSPKKVEDTMAIKTPAESVDNDVSAAKTDAELGDLEKLTLIERVRRLEEVVKLMEIKHKSEMSTLMSDLQTERETRSNLEKELERFIRTSSIV